MKTTQDTEDAEDFWIQGPRVFLPRKELSRPR